MFRQRREAVVRPLGAGGSRSLSRRADYHRHRSRIAAGGRSVARAGLMHHGDNADRCAGFRSRARSAIVLRCRDRHTTYTVVHRARARVHLIGHVHVVDPPCVTVIRPITINGRQIARDILVIYLPRSIRTWARHIAWSAWHRRWSVIDQPAGAPDHRRPDGSVAAIVPPQMLVYRRSASSFHPAAADDEKDGGRFF